MLPFGSRLPQFAASIKAIKHHHPAQPTTPPSITNVTTQHDCMITQYYHPIWIQQHCPSSPVSIIDITIRTTSSPNTTNQHHQHHHVTSPTCSSIQTDGNIRHNQNIHSPLHIPLVSSLSRWIGQTPGWPFCLGCWWPGPCPRILCAKPVENQVVLLASLFTVNT